MFESNGSQAGGGVPSGVAVLDRLGVAVDGVLDRRLDELDETALRAELAVIERARKRLHARACTVTATLTDRQASRAREAHPNDPRVAERARRQAQQDLAGQFGWSPSEAKQNREVGEQLTRSPEAAAAADDGELSVGHLRHLHRTLKTLLGEERRQAEARLLEAARVQDVATFARTCQTVLAELDGAAAEKAEQRRWQRRRASVVETPDGMTRMFGEWAGLEGEELRTAIDAFRRPDPPGEYRTPEQRTADAVSDLVRAVLTGGQAPTQHGTRPHVVMTIAAEDLKAGDDHAPVRFGSDRTTILSAVRRYLDDASWSWIVVDPTDPPAMPARAQGEPSSSEANSSGSSAPQGRRPRRAEWTSAHPERRDGGRLTLDTSALGCRSDHRKYDHGGWVITWNGRRPILHHPDRPPQLDPPPETGPDPGG